MRLIFGWLTRLGGFLIDEQFFFYQKWKQMCFKSSVSDILLYLFDEFKNENVIDLL